MEVLVIMYNMFLDILGFIPAAPVAVMLVDSVIVAGCECLPGEGGSKKQYAL